MKALPVLGILLGLVVVIVVLAMVTGCMDMLYSDSANALRKNQQANKDALAASKTASRQNLQGQPVTGEALVKLLTGNTHVSEYRRHSGDAKPYFTVYQYYGPGGAYVERDTYSKRTDGYESKGRWRVDQDVLCIVESMYERTEKCYTLRRAPGGTIEFWYHKPGDAFHGLIASSVSIVRPGPQTPEYTSATSPYER